MKNTTYIAPSLPGASPSPLRYRAWALLLIAAATLPLLLSTASSSFAGSATWKASPATGDWNTAGNWTAGGPPNGSADTATFATSNRTGVSLSANTEVNGIVFNAGGNAFTITAPATFTLTISGVGITNNSGITQNFIAGFAGSSAGEIAFTNSATAGSLTRFTNIGSAVSGAFGGFIEFFGTSTAGSGAFINNAGTVSGANGGFTQFTNSATADSGAFTNNGGMVSGASGGGTFFVDTSTAGSGTFTNNGGTVSGAGGGLMEFFNTSTAGNATLFANGFLGGGGGGAILFLSDSTGSTSRVEVFGNGTGASTDGFLDISFHNAPGVAIGSIEGSGAVFLGANKLTVGSNKRSTTFSGVMQDGGDAGGTGGSLTKTGKGKLSLTNANTYTGGTTVTKGTLLVKNTTGSATGSGAVHVNAGTLGGTGKIAGAVTLGTGSGAGAFLSPGNSATKPGTLTINNHALTFNADATYECALDRTSLKATQVVAKGVTINSAQFTFADLGAGTLTTGTVLTVINNTSASAIVGTFSNLADGSTFTSGGNTFQASYTGGTGNDLTLTVVP